MVKENIKLLTVEDVFFIERRGVVVMPFIREYSGPMSLTVILRRPDGGQASVKAHLDIPRINPPPKHYSFACLLANVTKQDVPIGTEIWTSNDPVP